MSSVPCWKRWLVAVRPFAFPASMAPVLIGTTLAVALTGHPFRPVLFFVSLVAMMLLHAGANILSDINDCRRGLDTVATPVSGAIVRGLMTTQQALREALVLLIAGVALGCWVAFLTTPWLLVLGAIGLMIGVFYTVPPIGLKYRALGDVAVFMDFGILGMLGAWMVQTREFSWIPIMHAVPIGLLVVAILHANNWRDAISDRKAGVRTMASWLGDRGSQAYYAFLLFAPFVYVSAAVWLTRYSAAPLPTGVLLVWLAFPKAVTCWRVALRRHTPRDPLDFVTLDAATAHLNIVFGLLYVAGILVSGLWARMGF